VSRGFEAAQIGDQQRPRALSETAAPPPRACLQSRRRQQRRWPNGARAGNSARRRPRRRRAAYTSPPLTSSPTGTIVRPARRELPGSSRGKRSAFAGDSPTYVPRGRPCRAKAQPRRSRGAAEAQLRWSPDGERVEPRDQAPHPQMKDGGSTSRAEVLAGLLPADRKEHRHRESVSGVGAARARLVHAGAIARRAHPSAVAPARRLDEDLVRRGRRRRHVHRREPLVGQPRHAQVRAEAKGHGVRPAPRGSVSMRAFRGLARALSAQRRAAVSDRADQR